MKRKLYISILFFAFVGLSAYSQTTTSNLVYSRVITKTFTLTNSSSNYDTVPIGKVWKMENIMHTVNTNMFTQYLEINSFKFQIPPTWYASSDHVMNSITPLWLKSGDVIRIICSSNNINFFYSIIEYSEK